MCFSALVKKDLEYLGAKYGAVWVREQFDEYFEDSKRDPRKFPPLMERIFPRHYAPVIVPREGKLHVELMRYFSFTPSFAREPDGHYNARRDNLHSPFWSNAFMKHHGFIVLEAFYEHVLVADLLKAGIVTIEQVKSQFEKKAQDRRNKRLSEGKPYVPTKEELKATEERKTVIEFRPSDAQDLLVPVVFSYPREPEGRPGFAIVTDEPPFEVASAGHDRCPVVLPFEVISKWIDPARQTSDELTALLGFERRVTFKHGLAAA